MNWAVIIAAASLMLAVVTAVFKLSKSISEGSKATGELVVATNDLKETFNEFKNNSRQTHKEIFHELDEHGKQLTDHEARIKIMEKEKKV